VSTNDDLVLRWEWPADRTAQARIAIRVDAIEPVSAGWFGLGRTPSIAENLPDPMRLRGAVVGTGQGDLRGTLAILLPRLELPALAPGDRAAIGVLGRACICIAAIPPEVGESQLAEWLSRWPCGSRPAAGAAPPAVP
jgi:hypothetical protein